MERLCWALLSSESKGEVDGQGDDLCLTKTFPSGKKKTQTQTSHIFFFWTIPAQWYRGKFAFCEFLFPCFSQQRHSTSSRQHTDPGMLLSSKLQSTERSIYLGYLWAVFSEGQHTAPSPDLMAALTVFRSPLCTVGEHELFAKRQRKVLGNLHRWLLLSY